MKLLLLAPAILLLGCATTPVQSYNIVFEPPSIKQGITQSLTHATGASGQFIYRVSSTEPVTLQVSKGDALISETFGKEFSSLITAPANVSPTFYEFKVIPISPGTEVKITFEDKFKGVPLR